jgi:hypothetical protein
MGAAGSRSGAGDSGGRVVGVRRGQLPPPPPPPPCFSLTACTSGRRAPSQSSQATVTTIHSETPEFDLRIARMGELVDPCDAEMLMLTQCLNEAGGRKEACAAASAAIRECHKRRDTALRAIDAKCAAPQSAYEGCMQANTTDPTRCIGLLDAFLVCAESATTRAASTSQT